jgi:2-polyprenyl-6-methoxyphenol hydroxylase-like FAD-dependent oxidoreductase
MLLENKTIAIIGGGPGGLTLAKLLQLKGAQVKLYERDFDKDARVQGGPLDMHENSGLAALREVGLLEQFAANFLPGADRMQILNEHAEVLFSDHDGKPVEDFGAAHFRPEIDRAALRKMLLESLEPGTVSWEKHFLSMETQGTGWLLHFANGSSVYADLVIGSDGANSKVRPYLTDLKLMYSGITMIEGNVYQSEKSTPVIHAMLKGGKIMAFGNEQDLLMGQKGGGDLGFYASFKAEPEWHKHNGLDYTDNAAMLKWFKNTYPTWSDVWHELFENATPPFIPRPINYMPVDQSWESLPNLSIIGDAAHVMPPFAGEGANMAMLDALELATCLTSEKYINMQEAIAAYEAAMRIRAAAATKESLVNGARMHAEMALQDMLEFFSQH